MISIVNEEKEYISMLDVNEMKSILEERNCGMDIVGK